MPLTTSTRRHQPVPELWAAGIKTDLQHRTLEDYLDAFMAAGLRLTKLADSRNHCFLPEQESILPDGFRFPRFPCCRRSPSPNSRPTAD
jgi:hypothetical protein